MRGAARLHADPARRHALEERSELRSRQLSAHRLRAIARDPMTLKEILRQIDANSDKLLHGRSPRWWRSSDHVLALDAVRVGPSTPSLRAQRSIPRFQPCDSSRKTCDHGKAKQSFKA